MNERDLIATQTIKQVVEGGDAVRADLKATAAAQDQLAASSNNLAVVTETSARRQTSAAAAFDAYSRRIDPASRALAELERNQRIVDRAFAQNSDMIDRAGQGLSVYKERLNAAAVAAETLRRQQSNASVNQGMGFNPSAANTSTYAAQFEAAAKAQDAQTASILRLRTAINPLQVEQGKLGVEMAHYKTLLQEGKITSAEYAQAQDMAGKRLVDFGQNLRVAGTAGRIMSGEMANLGFQLNDIVTGIALGQSPFMILAQQGGQVTQIFTNSKASIGEFATASLGWFNSLFTVGRVAFGGIAAAVGGAVYSLVSFNEAQREAGQALIGVGQRTGTTIAQINTFARENASAIGLSVDQARTVAVEFTKTGNISVAGLKGVGDAIHGFSILTGQDATEATKTFAKVLSGDLVQGAQELNKTYGFLDSRTREYIRTLELQGERSKAIQVIVDAMAADNQKAADSVGTLGRAWSGFINIASRVKDAIGSIGVPESPQAGLDALVAQRDKLQAGRNNSADPTRGFGGASLGTERLQREIDELQKKIDSITTDNAVKQLNKMSEAGDAVVKSAIPQIDQINNLESALKRLQDAQNTPGVSRRLGADDAAVTAIQNQIAALREAQGEAARYNQQVAAISQSWGNVGQSTALQLQEMQNALPVAQAWTNATRMRAQEQATYLDLLMKGKTAEEASAIAAKEYETSKASAVASGEKLVQSSQDNLDTIRAQGTGMEGVVASAIAYRDAIQAGATATQAATIAANTLQASLAQAAQAAARTAQAGIDAANGTENGIVTAASMARFQAAAAVSQFSVTPGKQYTSEIDPRGYRRIAQEQSIGVPSRVDTAYTNGGLAAAIAAATNAPNTFGFTGISPQGYDLLKVLGPLRSNIGDKISSVDQLTQLQNAQTSDKSVQISNLRSEMDWLATLPASIERDQKIVSLQDSIDQLTVATDANTAATQATLNPLYSQGHGALAIGYYKAATGLDGVVQGSGGVDSVPVHLMMTPGEPIKAGPAAMSSNDNSKQITVNQYFSGGLTNTRRRSMRQAGQGFSQSIAATG